MSESNNFTVKIIAGEDLLSLVDEAVESTIQGELKLPDIFASLEPFLTDVDIVQRSKGIQFLAELMEKLPAAFLSLEEVNVISEFLIAKLDEHFSITPLVLRALSPVVAMKNFSSSHVLNLLGNLQLHVTVQTLTQASRAFYYQILQTLFQSQQDVLVTKASDFVYAIVTGMDSEGDPRNLMFLFNFIPEVYRRFHLKHLAEEAFSVLECYFPIDFTPKEGCGISRDDLARGLENCLVSSNEFSPFIFPMVLEKLESSLKIAQVDSLKLLIRGFDVWDLGDVNSHASEITTALKTPIFQTADADIVDLALLALVSLLRRFSSSALNVGESETLDRILKFITDNTHRFLSDPSLTLFLPSTKVLCTVAGASSFCCSYIVKTVVSQLLALAEGKSGHDAVLTALSPILASCVRYELWDSDETRVILERVPPSLMTIMKDPSSQNGCFLCLAEIHSTLSSDLRGKLYKVVLELLSTNDPLPQGSYSRLLMVLAKAHPEELDNSFLDKISISETENTTRKKKKLWTYCWCCNVLDLTASCIDKIMDTLQSTSASEAIGCLRDYLSKDPPTDVLLSLGKQCDLIRRLHAYCLPAPNSSSVSAIPDEQNQVNISKIVEILMRQLCAEDQKATCTDCLRFYSLGNMDGNVASVQIELLKGLLVPLRKGVEIEDQEKVVEVLIATALRGCTQQVRQSSSVAVSSLVNKCQNEDRLKNTLQFIEKEIDVSLSSDAPTEAVELLSWVVKSLILRNHPAASSWLRKIIGLIDHSQVSMDAANGFKIILADFPELGPTNFCSQRLLFKQWVFQWVFDDQLTTLFNQGSESAQKAAALAISFVVVAVPTHLVISDIPKLIKVFVVCLENQNNEVCGATLDVLSKLLLTKEAVFEEYLDTLLPRFLNCCASKSMAVRMNALDCLYYYGKYPERKLIPYRNKVVHELAKSLDDHKRLVRQKAARTRSRWFLVGATDDR